MLCWLVGWLVVGSSRDLVANLLDCDIVVSEFELQSRYDFLIWTNTLNKYMNYLISSAMG